jgi:hypothetical protein
MIAADLEAQNVHLGDVCLREVKGCIRLRTSVESSPHHRGYPVGGITSGCKLIILAGLATIGGKIRRLRREELRHAWRRIAKKVLHGPPAALTQSGDAPQCVGNLMLGDADQIVFARHRSIVRIEVPGYRAGEADAAVDFRGVGWQEPPKLSPAHWRHNNGCCRPWDRRLEEWRRRSGQERTSRSPAKRSSVGRSPCHRRNRDPLRQYLRTKAPAHRPRPTQPKC